MPDAMKWRTLQSARDRGELEMKNERIEYVRFKKCALSIGGGGKRSTFLGCTFHELDSTSSLIGPAIFENCRFHNITEQVGCTLYEALFLECVFSGALQGFNFGFIKRSIDSAESHTVVDSNVQQAQKAVYCLDISSAQARNVGFLGSEIIRKVRFREGQCLILSDQDLAEKLLPIVRSSQDRALSLMLSTAAGFRTYKENLALVPEELQSDVSTYVRMIEDLGISVRTEPYC